MEGHSGLATAQLQTALSPTSTTITVDSTLGFFQPDLVWIDDEIICYTGLTATTFTGLTRGCHDSKPADHAITNKDGSSKRVYNEGTGLINQALGYNVLNMLSDSGLIKGSVQIITVLPAMLGNLVSKLVFFNYSFLEGPAVWIKYCLLLALGGGLIMALFQLVFKRG